MMKKKNTHGGKTIAKNKRARFEYHIDERIEAGLALEGWEVKSLRESRVQFADSYVLLKDNEAFLFGCRIDPLPTASKHITPDPTRTRKLLLKREEIDRLTSKVEQKGFTLVPINLHWKTGFIKCEVALAKGKAEHDKRDTIKDREGKREVERAMKSRNR